MNNAADSTDQPWGAARSGRHWYSSERLIWALIGLGILLRVAQYAANRSLWYDEALLASNIINKSWRGLFQPLDYGQGAPLGFLTLEKLVVQGLGSSEYALRLVPLLSGILSVFIFAQVAKRSLRPGAVPIALGLFAVLDPLIYYASEVKQYSIDVAVALIVFSSAQTLHGAGKLSAPRVLALAVIGALALWFSHPAVFILMGLGAVALMVLYRDRDWVGMGRFSVIALAWVLSLALSYSISLRHLSTNRGLLETWRGAFLPFPPSLSSVKWLEGTFFQLFAFPVGLHAVPGIAAFACLVGIIALWTEDRVELLALTLPLCFALAASAFHLYPFTGRFLLFAVPLIVLLIAGGAERIIAASQPHLPMMGILLLGLLFLYPVQSAGSYLVHARTVEEIKPAMAYLRAREERGDTVYVYREAWPTFKYYSGRYGFAAGSYVGGISVSDNGWKKYAADLDRLRGKPRVWILFSHIVGDEVDFASHYLDSRGTRLDSFMSDGAGVYLYDLTGRD
jgi:hypothetical protein